MVNLIILALLALGVFRGLKRGLILQTLHLIGFIASFLIAAYYYTKLAPHLILWIPYPELSGDGEFISFLRTLPLETGFYNAIAFILIFFSAKIVFQIIASMLDFVAQLPILNIANRFFGAVLGFVEAYLIIFILLFILALTPSVSVQEWINQSNVARNIIENTPYLSEQIRQMWFMKIQSILNVF